MILMMECHILRLSQEFIAPYRNEAPPLEICFRQPLVTMARQDQKNLMRIVMFLTFLKG